VHDLRNIDDLSWEFAIPLLKKPRHTECNPHGPTEKNSIAENFIKTHGHQKFQQIWERERHRTRTFTEGERRRERERDRQRQRKRKALN